MTRVLIIGGGLAGMSAAVALQSSGANVTLIEARKTLGGRAGSFEDPKTGETLDNCQHVLLGCCTNLIDFYRRINVDHLIHWQDTLHFFDPAGREHRLWGFNAFPAPFNLALAGASFGALTFKERIALSQAMLAILRLSPKDREKLPEISFGQWLSHHNQPDTLIDKFYDLVLVSALNENCRDAAASYAIQVFQEGMLANSEAYKMGTPACPLGELYRTLPCKDVRLGARMTSIRFEANRAVGVELAGEFLPADAIILAINYPALEKWIPLDLAASDSRFANLEKLQSVPILGAHLWFDRPVISTPHAALINFPSPAGTPLLPSPGTPGEGKGGGISTVLPSSASLSRASLGSAAHLQWLFRKPNSDGRAVHGVISAARDYLQRDTNELLNLFTQQIRHTFPQARNANLLRGSIIIEKRATFSPAPGSDQFRPPQSPPQNGIQNLYLAGDYTQTGWPATMEGAVRSGYLAAEAVLTKPHAFIVPDLPTQWPAKLLMRP